MKKCYKCKELLPSSDFYKNKNRFDGLATACPTCTSVIDKQKTMRDPERIKEQKRRSYRKTGGWLKLVDLATFSQMLTDQVGLCAICQKPETRKGKDGNIFQLCVDHDHNTNVVRQLLCHSCNVILGHLKDDVEIAKAIVTYLEKWKVY